MFSAGGAQDVPLLNDKGLWVKPVQSEVGVKMSFPSVDKKNRAFILCTLFDLPLPPPVKSRIYHVSWRARFAQLMFSRDIEGFVIKKEYLIQF